MIVEDHVMLSDSIKSWLEELFPLLVINQAHDGKEGWDFAGSENPDLAIIDIGLPGMNGIDLTNKIVSNGFKTQIIVLTNFDGKVYEERAYAAGAHAFISKQNMYNQLPSVITKLLTCHLQS